MTLTRNIVTDYGCPVNGTSDCRPAFLAFKADAQGLDAVLTVPAHTYNFKVNAGSNEDNFIFKGIPSLIVDMTGATVTDDAGAGGFTLGGSGLDFTVHNSPRVASARAGDTFVTCLNPTDALLFPVGRGALLTSYDLQGQWQSGMGAPPNAHNFDFVVVSATDGATGRVDFVTTPLKYTHLSTLPNYSQGATNGPDQGGPATLYVLDPSWNCAHDYRGGTINWNAAQAINANGESIIFRSITCIGTFGPIPSQNLLMRYIDCDLSGISLTEADKLTGTVSLEGSTKFNQLSFQSSSIDLLSIGAGVTITSLNGTPKRVNASNATIGTLLLGPIYGRADAALFDTCDIGAVTLPGAQLEQGTGAVGVNIAWTMSGGIITVPNTHGANPWAVPGTWLTFQGASESELRVLVLDVTQDVTNTYVRTTQPAGWPSVPLGSGGKILLQVHPSPIATFINCTGGAEVVDWSQAGAQGKPLLSYTKRGYATKAGGPAGYTILPNNVPLVGARAWGNVSTVKINVETAYAGAQGTATLFPIGGTHYPTIAPDSTSTDYLPSIDLRTAGLRTITPQGATSLGADANLTLPNALSWFTGLLAPQVVVDLSDSLAAVTIEVTTDQGFARMVTPLRFRLH